MRLRSLGVVLFVLSSAGCANAYTSTVVRTDGTLVETMPSCVTTDDIGRSSLRGTDLGDGIPVGQVADIRSHAGVEVLIASAASIVIGTAMIVWYATDNPTSKTTWRLAVGGPMAGIGLINAIVGAAMWSRSAGALSRPCHPRATVPR